MPGPPRQYRYLEGLLRLAVWRLTSLNGGERPKHLTLDIDGLPIEVHGHQGGSDYHGHVGARIYSPLIVSLAETGDMLGGLLREGNAGPAKNADTLIPHLVRRLNESTRAKVWVRIDAGFTAMTRWRPWGNATSSTWTGCAAIRAFRNLVGRAMADHMRTQLVLDALEMVVGRRQPERGLIHHSDRGSQLRFKRSSQHWLMVPRIIVL